MRWRPDIRPEGQRRGVPLVHRLWKAGVPLVAGTSQRDKTRRQRRMEAGGAGSDDDVKSGAWGQPLFVLKP